MRWTVFTNCDSFFITKCDTVYYKLRQVLQSAMNLLQIAKGITKCDDYYKLRQYRPSRLPVFPLDAAILKRSLQACAMNLRARSFQPKFQPFRPTVFSKLFRLDRTDLLSVGPKFPEILVEWIAPLVSKFLADIICYRQLKYYSV